MRPKFDSNRGTQIQKVHGNPEEAVPGESPVHGEPDLDYGLLEAAAWNCQLSGHDIRLKL